MKKIDKRDIGILFTFLLLFVSVTCFLGYSRVFESVLFRDTVLVNGELTCNDAVDFKSTLNVDGAVTLNSCPITTCNIGEAVSMTGTAVEYGSSVLHTTVITVDAELATTDSEGTGGYGSIKLYDFPEGHILVLGVVSDLDIDSTGEPHGIVADADGDFSYGTALCNAGTLTSTEADIIASTALTQLVTTAGVINAANSSAKFLDGTTTAKDIYLNVIFDDADSSASDTLDVEGTIIINWMGLGDY